MQTIELLTQIKEKLENRKKHSIIKALGYNSKKKGLNRLNVLLSCENVEQWLESSGYDFAHSNRSFLIKLCSILNFDEEYCLKKINKINKKLKDLSLMPQPYIFINTNFKRKSEPVFVLAYCEGLRRIYIAKKKVFMSDDKGLSIAKELVKKNYIEKNGILPVWGKIDNYIYHANNKKYILNKKGEIQQGETNIFESRAVISIRNRGINFIK